MKQISENDDVPAGSIDPDIFYMTVLTIVEMKFKSVVNTLYGDIEEMENMEISNARETEGDLRMILNKIEVC